MTFKTRGTSFCIALCLTGVSVSAQETRGGPANLEMGASYSSLRGPLVFGGFNAENLLGSGLDATLSYENGESGDALGATVRKTFKLGDTALGFDTYVDATFDGAKSNWDVQDYASEHYGATLRFGARDAIGLRYNGQLFWQTDTLDDLSDEISPLVTPLDDSTAIGVGLGLSYSTFTGRGPLATGFEIGASWKLATPAGDREWVAMELNGQYNAALREGMVLAFQGEAGQIQGRNGMDVGIVDRAFLGNPTPRGFAYGGIGPRDKSGDDVDTGLGGNSYFTSSMEMRVATPNPHLTIGAFADAAALWDLDQTSGGASGIIDDGFSIRSSVGLSLYWDTSIGLVQLNLAKPIAFDANDQEERLSLNLNFNF